jgi:hypothetical protein
MTIAEALAIADQAKPIRRQPLDKLHDSSVANVATGVTELAKRFDIMGHTASDMQKQLDRAKAGVELFYDVMKITPYPETLQ